jgi:hypothetical protein
VHQPIIEALQRHGFSPIVAVGAALAGGFAFWACAERPFVYTNARYRAIDFVHRLLEHGITRVGLGVTSFSLHRAPAVYQSVLDLERTA